tara:strand:+ start:470 stop:652 length:183 start_codon:yes stop_codon:yes gene_type:complete
MTFKPKTKPLTKKDLKEVSINYLRYVLKNSDDNKLIKCCTNEIKLRTTSTFFDGNKHIKI